MNYSSIGWKLNLHIQTKGLSNWKSEYLSFICRLDYGSCWSADRGFVWTIITNSPLLAVWISTLEPEVTSLTTRETAIFTGVATASLAMSVLCRINQRYVSSKQFTGFSIPSESLFSSRFRRKSEVCTADKHDKSWNQPNWTSKSFDCSIFRLSELNIFLPSWLSDPNCEFSYSYTVSQHPGDCRNSYTWCPMMLVGTFQSAINSSWA